MDNSFTLRRSELLLSGKFIDLLHVAMEQCRAFRNAADAAGDEQWTQAMAQAIGMLAAVGMVRDGISLAIVNHALFEALGYAGYALDSKGALVKITQPEGGNAAVGEATNAAVGTDATDGSSVATNDAVAAPAAPAGPVLH